MHILELTANVFAVVIGIVSAVTDAQVRKIYNALTYPGVLVGFIFHTVAALLFQRGIAGFLFSLYGFLLGFGFFFIFYWMSGGKKMGAGDVKLYAAVGACFGVYATLYSLIITALVGLLISIALLFPVLFMVIRTGQLSILQDYKNYPIPYGTVIGISVTIWVILRMVGLTEGLILPFYI